MLQKKDFKNIFGTIKMGKSLAGYTWVKTGGEAEMFFEPKDIDDLVCFLQQVRPGTSVQYIGGGSNLLVVDEGVKGIVIKLGMAFSSIELNDKGQIVCGAAAMPVSISHFACKNSLKGLEFMSTIPGTIGGAIFGNAGCFGGEIKDALASCKVVSEDGDIGELSNKDCGFVYRNSDITDFIVEATFNFEEGVQEEIAEKISEQKKKRSAGQPMGEKTFGSCFKNPEGTSAGALIDQAGLKGFSIGGAAVSEKHANFLINKGGATTQDFLDLIAHIQKVVLDKNGILLHPEVRVLS